MAAESGVSASTIGKFEAAKRRPSVLDLSVAQRVLEAAGVEFVDGVPGAMLRKPDVRDGRSVATLGQARVLLVSLPEDSQREPFWLCAAELLRDAANTGAQRAIDDAQAQMLRALKAEGLV